MVENEIPQWKQNKQPLPILPSGIDARNFLLEDLQGDRFRWFWRVIKGGDVDNVQSFGDTYHHGRFEQIVWFFATGVGRDGLLDVQEMCTILKTSDGLPRNSLKPRLRLSPPQLHKHGNLPSLSLETSRIEERYRGIKDANKE